MEENMEQPQDLGSINYGKFKDAESLLKAYSNLEAEFTKKSQRLSQLEGERNKEQEALAIQAKIEQDVEEFVTKYEYAQPFKSAIKESVQAGLSVQEATLNVIKSNYKSAEDYIKDDEFLNNFVYNNPNIKQKIIKDYLNKLTQNSPVNIGLKSANIPLTPPNVPTTIKEAGKMAKQIIKQI